MKITHKIFTKLFLLTSVLGYSFIICQAQEHKLSRLIRTHKSWRSYTDKIAPVRLPSSRLLVTVGDTLYLLNARREVLWKWDVGNGEDIIDRPIVDSQGFIYGIAIDGIVFSLDTNGQERWRWRMNGSYNFKRITPYGNDQYLLHIDASGYREIRGIDEEDALYLCKDREVLTKTRFPRKATLQVRGKRIYAVVKSTQGHRASEVRFHLKR